MTQTSTAAAQILTYAFTGKDSYGRSNTTIYAAGRPGQNYGQVAVVTRMPKSAIALNPEQVYMVTDRRIEMPVGTKTWRDDAVSFTKTRKAAIERAESFAHATPGAVVRF